MERVTILKPFGAPQAPPERGAGGARNLGRRWRPKFIFLSPPKAASADASTGAPQFFYFLIWRPNIFYFLISGAKGGARGATLPEGEGNPAEGGYFASLFQYFLKVSKLFECRWH